jgi:hypothetical protein
MLSTIRSAAAAVKTALLAWVAPPGVLHLRDRLSQTSAKAAREPHVVWKDGDLIVATPGILEECVPLVLIASSVLRSVVVP